MTRVMNSADISDTRGQALIDRLCRVDTDVVYFPVRHHSPTCARLVSELIDRLRPAAVLIEGPSDFNDRLDELLLKHEMPVAIYSYFRCGGASRGVYYPFCEYSPEWVALRKGRRRGTLLRFIDLPWGEMAHLDNREHRYADVELRRGRYIKRLCVRMQVDDFDDLWDRLIESQALLGLEEYLRRMHSLCFHIRREEDFISPEDRLREAFMAEQIRSLRTQVSGPLLVVTGGFHSSALAARGEGFDCPGIDDTECPVADDSDGSTRTCSSPTEDADLPCLVPVGEPFRQVEERGSALMAYSYERLDGRVDYDAGMPSPAFYEQVWRQKRTGREFSHHPLLIQLVDELRRRHQILSTADLIAVETAARALAALRGRSCVWRRDLIDAVTTSLIKDELEYGCDSPFIEAIHAVLRGSRQGRLAAGTQMPPLVLEIHRELSHHGLTATATECQLELDLLSPQDLAKSRLLHRLQLLRVAGFKQTSGVDFLKRNDLTRLEESWTILWSPQFEGTCIEAARYGTCLMDAVTARLLELADTHEGNASAAAALLVQGAQSGIETLSDQLLDRLAGLIQEEIEFTVVTGAVGHLLFLFCHDEIFGTSRLPQVGRILGEAFSRSLWLLETLAQSAGNDAQIPRGILAMLETVQRCGESLELDREEFIAAFRRAGQDSRKPPMVRGAAAGVLWTLEIADDNQILSDLLLLATPNQLGDFLSGLFALAREVAQRQPRLVQTIDRLLLEFTPEEFLISLPALRLAFTYFTPREKSHMLQTLFDSLGLQEAPPQVALTVHVAVAVEALAVEERLLATRAKYGLEEPDHV